MAHRLPAQRREAHGLRELNRNTYFGLFLFGLFNPVVTPMRALCAATRLNRASGMLGKVVARMRWAKWRFQHCEQKAVRLHIKLRLVIFKGPKMSEQFILITIVSTAKNSQKLY